MTRVSVFTPSHNPRYLHSCYDSLCRQTNPDWEWIVLLNGASPDWSPEKHDERVLVSRDEGARGVGAAKRVACELASGDVLVELDHDDELASSCLERVADAFEEHPEVGFVYSDCAQINEDESRNEAQFDHAHGWRYSDVSVDGRFLLRCHSLAPSPHNVSYIWYAPNHVRAFRRSVYEQVGGYDPSRTILDDQDLMCRMYEAAPFFHIRECLYLQRVHGDNTQSQLVTNRRIQRETVDLYDTYVQRLALAWAAREGLHCLDLGAAFNKPDGYLGVDKRPGPGVDIVTDLTGGIDLPDSSVGVIRAVDFLGQVADKVALFNEIHRLLAHGGMLLTLTPSTDGRGPFQDPTSVAYYNENSFWYFTDASYAALVPEISCRFQVGRMTTHFPSPWHRQHEISYVNANLVALKEGPRQGGIRNW